MNASFSDGKLTLTPQTEKGAKEFKKLKAWLSSRSYKDKGSEIELDISVLQRFDKETVKKGSIKHDGSG
jgi:hypothetical protein